jgi:hypothetical protein
LSTYVSRTRKKLPSLCPQLFPLSSLSPATKAQYPISSLKSHHFVASHQLQQVRSQIEETELKTCRILKMSKFYLSCQITPHMTEPWSQQGQENLSKSDNPTQRRERRTFCSHTPALPVPTCFSAAQGLAPVCLLSSWRLSKSRCHIYQDLPGPQIHSQLVTFAAARPPWS